jgi:hypothetical protein
MLEPLAVACILHIDMIGRIIHKASGCTFNKAPKQTPILSLSTYGNPENLHTTAQLMFISITEFSSTHLDPRINLPPSKPTSTARPPVGRLLKQGIGSHHSATGQNSKKNPHPAQQRANVKSSNSQRSPSRLVFFASHCLCRIGVK